MQKYLSTSRYRRMSSAKFAENVFGIKLYWHQKIILYIHDINLKIQKRHFPTLYLYTIQNILEVN